MNTSYDQTLKRRKASAEQAQFRRAYQIRSSRPAKLATESVLANSQMSLSRPTRILLLESDTATRELLCRYLSDFGMQVLAVTREHQLSQHLAQSDFDLVVLGLLWRSQAELSLCRELREQSMIPIIVLTAQTETAERVLALEQGADDCLVKPFDPRELVARINCILRRSRRAENKTQAAMKVSFSGWQLDKVQRHLYSPQQVVVPLANAEFRVLSCLIEHSGRALSREQLLEMARGRDIEPFERSIDLLISRLRQKLNEDSKAPQLIKTVRGVGYMFSANLEH